jgi:hypothetical protein
MSLMDHSLPMYSAPVPNDVRFGPKATELLRRSEMTLSAISEQRTAANGIAIRLPRRRW